MFRPPPRTKWTRRVPHPVLIGHAASLTTSRPARGAWRRRAGRGAQGAERAWECSARRASSRCRSAARSADCACRGARVSDTPARVEDTPARVEDTPTLVSDTPRRAKLQVGGRWGARHGGCYTLLFLDDLPVEGGAAPGAPPLVLSGHAASLTPY